MPIDDLEDIKWDDRAGRWVGWSGTSWQSAMYSADPSALRDIGSFEEATKLSDERRARFLDKAVREELMRGSTVLDKEQFDAVLGRRRPVRHWLHAVMTFVTFGLWSTVWIVMALARKEDRFRMEVDPWGHVWGRTS